MSKWGVFDYDGDQHVMPCTDDGEVLGDHKPDADCVCHPRMHEPHLWVHNDYELGGADA